MKATNTNHRDLNHSSFQHAYVLQHALLPYFPEGSIIRNYPKDNSNDSQHQ